VRVPIAGAEELDFRALPEPAVLAALENQGFSAPRLIHADPSGRFALHSYVAGERLDALYPVRALLPDWVATDLALQLARLHALEPAPLRNLQTDLPASPASAELFGIVVAFTERCYARLHPRHAPLYARLGIPADPLAVVREEAARLRPRPFVICHTDITRRNLIVTPGAERLTIIDWELALLADPAYDLGVHLHRIRYQPHQEELFLDTYLAAVGEQGDMERWRTQIAVYRRHEQVRSALVDAARTVEDLREDLAPEVRGLLVNHYAVKLRQAWQIWGVAPDPSLEDTGGLMAVLEEEGCRLT
jgi:aminoglycoside phosphotransferase (APT) family kinase protein